MKSEIGPRSGMELGESVWAGGMARKGGDGGSIGADGVGGGDEGVQFCEFGVGAAGRALARIASERAGHFHAGLGGWRGRGIGSMCLGEVGGPPEGGTPNDGTPNDSQSGDWRSRGNGRWGRCGEGRSQITDHRFQI